MTTGQERVQGLLNSISEGAGRQLLRGILFVCCAALLFGAYGSRQFRGLSDPAAMDTAHLARNLAEGRGYVTDCVRPLDLWYLDHVMHTTVPFDLVPELRSPPLFPLLLSVGMRMVRPDFSVDKRHPVYGPETLVVVPFGILFSLATAGVLFLLGRLLVGPAVGVVTAVIYLLTHSVLSYSFSGLPVPLLAFLSTTVAWAILSAASRQAAGSHNIGWIIRISLAGVCCGLAILTNYAMVALAVLAIALIVLLLYRFIGSAVFLFVFLAGLVVAPWVVYNMSRGVGPFGVAPYTLASHSHTYAGDTLDRTPQPDLDRFQLVRAIKSELVPRGADIVSPSGSFLAGGGVVMCFFVLSLFVRFERAGMNEFRWAMWGGLLVFMLAALLMPVQRNHLFFAVFPLMVALGVATCMYQLEREEFFEQGWQPFLLGTLILLTALPTALRIAERGHPAYPPYYPPLITAVCSMLEDGERICTDIPWATAWYARQPSLLLPQAADDIAAMDRFALNIKGLYLTTETGNRSYTTDLKSGASRSWLPFLESRVPADFPLQHAIWLPPATSDQLFLTDRPRWATPRPTPP